MTRFVHRIVIVVPAARQAAANALARQIDPVGGDKTFTVPLSPTGALPATHYWCATSATVEGKGHILSAESAAKVARWTPRVFIDTDPETVLATMGLKRIQSSVVGG